jgi:putative two-component system response regulator
VLGGIPLLAVGAGVLWLAGAATADGADDLAGHIRLAGGVAAGVLAVAIATATGVIVRRYERRIADINENLEEIVRNRSAALVQSRSAVILGLAKLAESRDDQTGHHLERIRSYVRILGEEMLGTDPEVDEEFVNTIVDTSALHDIGKVGVPDHVLLNPGELSPEEREIIEKHPLIGGDTLLAVKRRWGDDRFLVTACEICFAHHEHYDGSGYPFGLKGDIIPLAARIVALADVYDALTTLRVYKGALCHDEAREMIVERSGTQFDPKVVDAFLAAEERFTAVPKEPAVDAAPFEASG